MTSPSPLSTTNVTGRSAALAGRPCVVCGTPVVAKVQSWTARCPSCGTWTSDLAVEINQHNRHVDSAVEIDADARVVGLEALRKRNFTDILDGIEALRPLRGARLLDVGSAHGWFLDAALERGCLATGAEPEEAVAAEPLARGLDVRVGYFPDVVEAGEQFDIITSTTCSSTSPTPARPSRRVSSASRRAAC